VSPAEQALREQLVATCKALRASGLTFGTSGNVSARRDARSFLISPTAVDYDDLDPAGLALLQLDGSWLDGLPPSTEWRMHRDVLAARPEVCAVVHTHSPYATALACRGEGIPAFHYMVAIAGGDDIRCAPYRTFGTQELSDVALPALRDRRACLLGNHGVLATGAELASALRVAGEVENLARQDTLSRLGGEPRLLDAEEMRRVVAKFDGYGATARRDTLSD
jgi:L-fuculose-phosphate aldolase